MPRRKSRRSKVRAKTRSAATWRELVHYTLHSLDGEAPLAAIYARLESHPRAKGRRHFRAKIRQVLELHPDTFVRVEKGVWALARRYSKKDVKRFERIRRKECPTRSDTD